MKKLFLILLIFLISVPVNARIKTRISTNTGNPPSVSNIVHSGTGATTFYGCFLNGGAFFFSDLDITSYQGKQLEITDSGSKITTGYISTAMTSDTYGSELISNGNFETYAGIQDDGTSDTFTGWTTAGIDADDLIEATATVHGGSNALKFTKVGNGPLLYNSSAVTIETGALYYLTLYNRGSGGVGGQFKFTNVIGTYVSGETGNSYVKEGQYANATSTAGKFNYNQSDAGTSYLDDVSFKKVTALNGGVQIVSVSGGSTRNFEDIELGFTYNDIASIRILQVIEY